MSKHHGLACKPLKRARFTRRKSGAKLFFVELVFIIYPFLCCLFQNNALISFTLSFTTIFPPSKLTLTLEGQLP